MRADTHLMGSQRGYGQLAASAGVSEAERVSITGLDIGQPAGGRADRLERDPVVLCRILPSGRIGLTRCVAGDEDEAGRATLQFRTLLMDRDDWVDKARHDLAGLLADAAIWGSAAFDNGQPLSWSPLAENKSPISREVWAVACMVRVGPRPILLRANGPTNATVASMVSNVSNTDAAKLQWGLGLGRPVPGLDVATIGVAASALEQPVRHIDHELMAAYGTSQVAAIPALFATEHTARQQHAAAGPRTAAAVQADPRRIQAAGKWPLLVVCVVLAAAIGWFAGQWQPPETAAPPDTAAPPETAAPPDTAAPPETAAPPDTALPPDSPPLPDTTPPPKSPSSPDLTATPAAQPPQIEQQPAHTEQSAGTSSPPEPPQQRAPAEPPPTASPDSPANGSTLADESDSDPTPRTPSAAFTMLKELHEDVLEILVPRGSRPGGVVNDAVILRTANKQLNSIIKPSPESDPVEGMEYLCTISEITPLLDRIESMLGDTQIGQWGTEAATARWFTAEGRHEQSVTLRMRMLNACVREVMSIEKTLTSVRQVLASDGPAEKAIGIVERQSVEDSIGAAAEAVDLYGQCMAAARRLVHENLQNRWLLTRPRQLLEDSAEYLEPHRLGRPNQGTP